MNFKKLLEEKNLKVEELPKRLQKKIQEIENVADRVEELKKLNLDEAEKDVLFEAQVKLSSLDKEIEKSIRKFNPEVYRKRLEHIERVTEQRLRDAEELEKAQEAYEQKQEQQEENIPEFQEQEDIIDITEEQVADLPEDQHEFVEVDDKIQQKLKELRKEVKIKPERYVEEHQIQQVSEFDKVDNATPRKMSKGLILMGVGAFLLTWGAVNFFKERRG